MIQLLRMLSPTIWAIRMYEAAEAFETPPRTRAACRYGALALCLLMAAAALLLTAALVDTFANARLLSERFGWAGIACLILCVYCGLRYKAANLPRL
jgi:hypothetical protein